MRKVLIDTNAYASFFFGDETVLDILAKAQIVYMSVFVLGELYAGFRGGKKQKQNRLLLDEFLLKPSVSVIDATRETSEIFGQIKYTLKRAGTPMPINDVWIASHVFETGSVLISYDAHFLRIPGLRIWDEISESK
ncbi:MAG: type II toxin-antitoxin system VapC family toxin [Candidatus Aminicenantes bacterium]|jgi:tRNA(fMet)-specific endonuclease VapC